MKTIGEKIDEELAIVKNVMCKDYCKYYQVLYWCDMDDKVFDELIENHCSGCPMEAFGY